MHRRIVLPAASRGAALQQRGGGDGLHRVEFSPDVLWLATPECKRSFDEAFLAALAERLVAAEGRSPRCSAGKSVTLF
jgi:hypothetical protein